MVNFSETLIPYECKTDWIPEELRDMLNTLNSETIPEGNISCMNCAYANRKEIKMTIINKLNSIYDFFL